jgi:hypothetical protein
VQSRQVESSLPISSERAPPQIRDAVNLMWGCQALGVLGQALYWRYLAEHEYAAILVPAWLVSIVVWAWLILKIKRGRNWARITALAFTAVSLPSMLQSGLGLLQEASLDDALVVIAAFMQCAALWLLFTDPGRLWFRKGAKGVGVAT